MCQLRIGIPRRTAGLAVPGMFGGFQIFCHDRSKTFDIKLMFMFSKKAAKIEKNLHRRFDTYLVNVKLTVKIWSIFVAFLENMNFTRER